ncbi:MAG: DNA translocase FtsK 4TM domain-containing protein [Chloroflexi bacterium]|nr:DNA translocase FtsK 4TM domain-containing protein [Chloroflexota bacterium]
MTRKNTKPRKPNSRKSTRSRAASKKTTPQPVNTSLWGNLSLDRKLDIAGVVMALVGLITFFGLLSVNNGLLMGGWVTLLTRLFGWGVYVFPIGLILVGVWLILRDFERLPQLSVERGAGIVLLFGLFLTLLHFALLPADRETAFALASEGRGGGYIGAGILQILRSGFGWGGAAVTLLAWLLLALAITLDRPVLGLFEWMRPLILRIQDAWDELRAGREAQTLKAAPAPGDAGAESTLGLAARPEAKAATPGSPSGASPWDSASPQTWVLPRLEEILDAGVDIPVDDEFDRHRAQVIEETLASFDAPARVVEINRGPTITQFGVEPAFIESRGKRTRVRVGKIAALADDMALALAATRIRIQAPVPGRGFVGIEVPNEETAMVALRDGIENKSFQRLEGRPLRFALGQDVAGNAVAADLAAMPHILIAGTTGSGKSVCVNAIISCLLLNNTPDDLRMLMIDPKRVELTGYNGVPHLLAPVVVDLERVVGALQWATREMDQRYHKFAAVGARNIAEYNQRMEAQGERTLPYLVVIIDELADLMMLAPDETERTITRMAQLARATGIHMVISTQRPSVDVVTGLIKANFPARIAFATASGIDSRVILDQPGAERLLGRGDMLFQAPDAAAPVRLQGVFVSENELLRLVQYWRGLTGYVLPTSVATAAGGVPDMIPAGVPLKQMPLWDEIEAEKDLDPLFNESVDLIRRRGRASISMLQRRLRIGYTRAARLIETIEEKGIISAPQPGSQVREVLDYGQAAPPVGEE